MHHVFVDQMIQKAAIEAEINTEQSFRCLKAAFSFITEVTQKHGGMDLSSLGLPGIHSRRLSIKGSIH
ncbi:hypothetical protein [Aneurinibacillus aneurinilyticus]|uniref:hypothetical protein n=1 Tax=Aneurinibacillus aneurinilyticus TaxID=1391 RepID=UPI0023F13479|nr:hypothetical protein [Aneurinibacillus aneurinilyticus]